MYSYYLEKKTSPNTLFAKEIKPLNMFRAKKPQRSFYNTASTVIISKTYPACKYVLSCLCVFVAACSHCRIHSSPSRFRIWLLLLLKILKHVFLKTFSHDTIFGQDIGELLKMRRHLSWDRATWHRLYAVSSFVLLQIGFPVLCKAVVLFLQAEKRIRSIFLNYYKKRVIIFRISQFQVFINCSL